MKIWLKILFVLWFVISVWYYLCQINAHCSTNINVQKGEANATLSKENVLNTLPEKVQQKAQNAHQDSTLNVQTKAQEIQKRLEKIEQLYSSKPIFSFKANETSVIIKLDKDDFVKDLLFYLKHRPNSKLKLIGHTDNFGTNALNYRLGKWRAKNAIDVLTRAGIERGKLILASKGETVPIADNRTARGRKENRRVEIQFIH